MSSRNASASSSRPSTDLRQRDVLFHERLQAVVQHGHGDLRRDAPTSSVGLSGGTTSRRITPCAMFTAWSPTRSRSVFTLMIERTSRRSDATGILQREELDAQVVDLELELVDRAHRRWPP